MSEKEVEGILGRAGMSPEKSEIGHFFDLRHQFVLAEPNYLVWSHNFGTHKYWTSQRGCIQVNFDSRGYVREKAFWRSAEPTFIDRIRDWLGW